MSQHEIEDLIEDSVRVLAGSPQRDTLDLRSIFWRLYQFENEWDTSFTQFRVLELLIEQRLVYRFDLAQHPDYERARAFFDALTGTEFIGVDPLRPVGGGYRDRATGEWFEANHLAGYVRTPYLYCEAGSPLWARFVKQGTLTGRDVLPPDANVGITDAAFAAVTAAEQAGNIKLIATWYTVLSTKLLWSDLDALSNDKSLAGLLAVVQRTNASAEIPPRLIELGYEHPPLPADLSSYIEQLKARRPADEDL